MQEGLDRFRALGLGPGLAAVRIVVRTKDVGFLKGILEGHEGLAVVFAESGGDLVLACAEGREEELRSLAVDLATELGGILT
jgi:hypothetical protein